MTRTIGFVDRMRWMSACAAALAVTLAATMGVLINSGQSTFQVAAAASPATPGTGGSSAPLDPRIAAIAARHPGEVVETIVQFKPGVGLDRARWTVARVQGKVFGELQIINALAVKLSAREAQRLAASSDVHAVSLNTQVKVQSGSGGGGPSSHTLENTYDWTLGVPHAWTQGLTGAGIGVAVIDTGIDGNLPDFQSSNHSGSRVIATAVTNPGAHTALDTFGHGTDVAGIVAGNGNNLSMSDPMHGRFIGVAPDANLIAIKASDDSGRATVLDVIYGLQFAVDHQAQFNIRVVNMSLDSRTPQSYTTDPLDAAAESAWLHGITVVVAAGNRGTDADAVQYAPANDPYVITVGAVNENGTSNPADDVIAPWSSLGITQDGFQKPDVTAPGAHIISVLAPNSLFSTACKRCIVGGEYIRTSGTSMAAPMISGVVALMLQAHPSWTPDQVKGALTNPSVASNPALLEVDAARAISLQNPAAADGGLTPNSLVDPATGDINYGQSSWSQSSWSQATGPYAASFAQSSWSQSSWSTSSWSTSSWSTSSWSTYFDHSSIVG